MSKTILITGSSTGIGKTTAKFFQAKGWNVVATMRTPEKETELNQLENVFVTRLDVQDYSSIETAVGQSIEKFGEIDVVLNNAGYGLMGTFESITQEQIARQYGVNVFGLFDVTRAVLPHFREKHSGMFINISSVGGKITFPLVSLYHSTKFAIEGFSEALHYELAAIGIDVKLVEPGGVATDFGGRSMVFQHDEKLEEYNPFVGNVMGNFEAILDPTNMSQPELVAEVIYTAATDETNQLRYIAGADAEQFVGARKAMSDDEFFTLIKGQLKLE